MEHLLQRFTQYMIQLKVDFQMFLSILVSYYTHISSTIPDLKFIINAAHKLGMKVMLKPHIDL